MGTPRLSSCSATIALEGADIGGARGAGGNPSSPLSSREIGGAWTIGDDMARAKLSHAANPAGTAIAALLLVPQWA